jgi:predicted transcriptional regulator
MTMRSFSLKDPEAYAILCQREDRPWIPNGALPREPRWGHRSDPVQVMAESEAEAQDAFKAWLAHVEAGRINPEHQG